MSRALLFLFALSWTVASLAEDVSSMKFPSPDGRFALRTTQPKGNEDAEVKIDLIEKASGKVMVPLGSLEGSRAEDSVLVWSADSKKAAYGSRDDEPGTREMSGGTVVFFWNGSTFDKVTLPEKLPSPKITFAKGAGADVKPYGGIVLPLRWLKSGELELSSEEMMLSRVDDKSYTGIVQFTIAFDAKHVPSVKTVGKSKTEVE
jgi:hypothetical protein